MKKIGHMLAVFGIIAGSAMFASPALSRAGDTFWNARGYSATIVKETMTNFGWRATVAIETWRGRSTRLSFDVHCDDFQVYDLARGRWHSITLNYQQTGDDAFPQDLFTNVCIDQDWF